MKHKYQAAADL